MLENIYEFCQCRGLKYCAIYYVCSRREYPPSLIAVLYLSLEDEGELIVFQPNNFKRIPAARGELLKDKGLGERDVHRDGQVDR